MPTTTFKSVGGTSKPAAEPAGKQKAAPAAAKPQKKAAKPAATKPARKPGTIIIEGEGTIPVYVDGAMRRLPRGVPVKASAAEIAILKRSNVKFA